MLYAILGDLVVLVHILFILFVIMGGGAVLRWPRLAWLHLPAAIWGVTIEIGGCVCPLTYLENHFRLLEGKSGYVGSFIEEYLESLLYPLGLTQNTQWILGMAAFGINFAVYTRLWLKRRGV